MLQGVPAALGWNPSSPCREGQRLLLGDTLEADAAPFMHDVVAYYLRAGSAVLYLGCRLELGGLLGLYRRLGFDLNMLEAQGRFRFVSLAAYLLDGPAGVPDVAGGLPAEQPRTLLVVDEAAAFEDVDGGVAKLMRLVAGLEARAHTDMLVYMHQAEDASPLWRWLAHRASSVLQTRALVSGLSREFHGQLTMSRGGKSYLCPQGAAQTYLYRTSETSVFFTAKAAP